MYTGAERAGNEALEGSQDGADEDKEAIRTKVREDKVGMDLTLAMQGEDWKPGRSPGKCCCQRWPLKLAALLEVRWRVSPEASSRTGGHPLL